jgi:hypothetical protein
VRKAANKGVAGVASLFSARAAAPSMVTRSEWGASRCGPRRRSDSGSVKAVFVHHTVTANGYSRSDGPSMVLGICRWHVNNNGWDDIGYYFLVDKYGQIYEGRNGGITRANVGAQAQGWNAQSTGIANIGDHSSSGQSSSGLRAMDRLITWKAPGPQHAARRTRDAGLRRRAAQPLPRGPPGELQPHLGQPRRQQDRVPRQRPLRSAPAPAPRRRERSDTTPPATPRDLVARPGNVALN